MLPVRLVLAFLRDSRGRFRLLHWLQQHIHASGRTLKSEAIVEKVSGKLYREASSRKPVSTIWTAVRTVSNPVELI